MTNWDQYMRAHGKEEFRVWDDVFDTAQADHARVIALESEVARLTAERREAQEASVRIQWDLDTASANILELHEYRAKERAIGAAEELMRLADHTDDILMAERLQRRAAELRRKAGE